MSVYGIEHVIGECLEERLKVSSVSRGQTIGARQEIYWESWNALNLWIESRLAKKLVFYTVIWLSFGFYYNNICYFYRVLLFQCLVPSRGRLKKVNIDPYF